MVAKNKGGRPPNKNKNVNKPSTSKAAKTTVNTTNEVQVQTDDGALALAEELYRNNDGNGPAEHTGNVGELIRRQSILAKHITKLSGENAKLRDSLASSKSKLSDVLEGVRLFRADFVQRSGVITDELRASKVEQDANVKVVENQLKKLATDSSREIGKLLDKLRDKDARLAKAKAAREEITANRNQLIAMLESVHRSLNIARKESFQAQREADDSVKKLNDKLFLAGNQKCRNCAVVTNVRVELANELAASLNEKNQLLEQLKEREKALAEKDRELADKEAATKWMTERLKTVQQQLGEEKNKAKYSNEHFAQQVEKFQAKIRDMERQTRAWKSGGGGAPSGTPESLVGSPPQQPHNIQAHELNQLTPPAESTSEEVPGGGGSADRVVTTTTKKKQLGPSGAPRQQQQQSKSHPASSEAVQTVKRTMAAVKQVPGGVLKVTIRRKVPEQPKKTPAKTIPSSGHASAAQPQRKFVANGRKAAEKEDGELVSNSSSSNTGSVREVISPRTFFPPVPKKQRPSPDVVTSNATGPPIVWKAQQHPHQHPPPALPGALSSGQQQRMAMAQEHLRPPNRGPAQHVVVQAPPHPHPSPWQPFQQGQQGQQQTGMFRKYSGATLDDVVISSNGMVGLGGGGGAARQAMPAMDASGSSWRATTKQQEMHLAMSESLRRKQMESMTTTMTTTTNHALPAMYQRQCMGPSPAPSIRIPRPPERPAHFEQEQFIHVLDRSGTLPWHSGQPKAQPQFYR